jgi:hypothetical protein
MRVRDFSAVTCPRDGRKTRGKLFQVGSVRVCESCSKAPKVKGLNPRRVR